MIINEFYDTRTDGVNLYKTYSSTGMMIRQIDTGVEYSEAIDVEGTPHTYEETTTPIPNEDFIDAQDALNVVFGEGVE